MGVTLCNSTPHALLLPKETYHCTCQVTGRRENAYTCKHNNSHTDPIFKHFEILKLFQINLKQINKFIHRYSYNTLPTVFSNFFTPSAVHSYNTRNSSTI